MKRKCQIICLLLLNRTVCDHGKLDYGEKIIKKLNLLRNKLHVKLFILARNWKIQISKIHVLEWLKIILYEFLDVIVQNSFTGSGYYYKDRIDYSGKAESDCSNRINVSLVALWLPTRFLKHFVLQSRGTQQGNLQQTLLNMLHKQFTNHKVYLCKNR